MPSRDTQIKDEPMEEEDVPANGEKDHPMKETEKEYVKDPMELDVDKVKEAGDPDNPISLDDDEVIEAPPIEMEPEITSANLKKTGTPHHLHY